MTGFSGDATSRHPLAAAAGFLMAVTALAVAAVPAAAAPAPRPAGLSVTLTDGTTQVHANSDVTYTATLTNSGPKPVAVTVVLTVPAYLTITRAAEAKRVQHRATWTLTAPAGKHVTRTATAHVAAIPKTEQRVTAILTVYQGKTTTGRPLIGTAVANTIPGRPTGTASTSPHWSAAAPAAKARQTGGGSLLLPVGAPLAATLLFAAVGAWRLRRHHHSGHGRGNISDGTEQPHHPSDQPDRNDPPDQPGPPTSSAATGDPARNPFR